MVLRVAPSYSSVACWDRWLAQWLLSCLITGSGVGMSLESYFSYVWGFSWFVEGTRASLCSNECVGEGCTAAKCLLCLLVIIYSASGKVFSANDVATGKEVSCTMLISLLNSCVWDLRIRSCLHTGTHTYTHTHTHTHTHTP